MIIVTGSEGYIGSHLTRLFNESLGFPYVGLDRRAGLDILSPEGKVQFETLAKTAETVIHLAAQPRIPASWTNTSNYIRDNIELTEYVARICAENKCHLIFASSSSVYGNGDGPLNPYSWTKLSAEDIVKIYGDTLDLNYTIVRIFTTYGNNGPLVIDKWINQAKNNQPITLRGTGNQRRDFIHVEDVAYALAKTVESLPYNLVIDIGTGQNYSLNELVGLFNSEIIVEDELTGYAQATLADTREAEKYLGWYAKHTLPDWIKTNLSK
jgi:UDP-glucose 4-epimerase